MELRLETPEGILASGTFHASSRLLAEQMAARRLLELLRGGGGASSVAGHRGAGGAAQAAEPQGSAVGAGDPAQGGPARLHGRSDRVRVRGEGRPCRCGTSPRSCPAPTPPGRPRPRSRPPPPSSSRRCTRWMHGERPKSDVRAPTETMGDPAPPSTPRRLRGKDPRVQLNEMRQLGLIQGFGFELVEQRGPPHLPIFVMRGYLETAGGERRHTEPLEAEEQEGGRGSPSRRRSWRWRSRARCEGRTPARGDEDIFTGACSRAPWAALGRHAHLVDGGWHPASRGGVHLPQGGTTGSPSATSAGLRIESQCPVPTQSHYLPPLTHPPLHPRPTLGPTPPSTLGPRL